MKLQGPEATKADVQRDSEYIGKKDFEYGVVKKTKKINDCSERHAKSW